MGLLRTGVPTVGIISLAMMGGAPMAAVCAYLLRATFDAANQGFADAQVLNTEAEGIQDGQLTVVELDGTLAIVGNECAFTAQGTPAWGDLGFYSGAITRARGRTLLGGFNFDSGAAPPIGWQDGVNLDSTDRIYWFYCDGALDIYCIDAVWTGAKHGRFAFATDYKAAVVLGGYDVNGVPWHDGAVGTFEYGASFYIQGGTFATWTLLWRSMLNNTVTLYAIFTSYNAPGTIDNFRVPDADLSAVLEPLVKDTFTDANGTSLDAHTPDVDVEGGGWTEQAGNWDIQGNKATAPTAAALATVGCGDADVLIVCDITMGAGGNHGNEIVLRRDAVNGYRWSVQIHCGDNKIKIIERGLATTERAATAVAIASSTEYRVVSIADGQDITGFVDGAARVAYGVAALNETETTHGLTCGTTTVPYFDNFHVHARTAAVYDTTLDLC